MKDHLVKRGLLARRASIISDLEELEKARRQLVASLRHIDGCLKLMDKKFDSRILEERKKRRSMFRRGQLTQMIYVAEREYGKFIHNKEIAALILKQMDWEDDGELLGVVATKVSDARRNIRYRKRYNRPRCQ